jgi:hypothetical protein
MRESDFEAVGREAAVGAVRDLYDVLRELTDSGLVDLDEFRHDTPGMDLADAITTALTRGADIVAQVFGPEAVK